METTNTQNQTQQVVATKKIKKVKRVLANKSIFFSIFVVIFAAASFFMFCLDKENFLRTKFDAPWLDKIADFFTGTLGINFDVTMMSWISFFIFVIVFFAVFTTLFFRKTFVSKFETNQILKKGQPLSAKQKTLFNVIYYILAALVMAGLILVIFFVVVPLLTAMLAG